MNCSFTHGHETNLSAGEPPVLRDILRTFETVSPRPLVGMQVSFLCYRTLHLAHPVCKAHTP